jgi:tripartite-type tricarboxylate transporter receptor subunit TctC
MKRISHILLASLLAVSATAHAQEWPTKQPIRLIVPFPAGGPTDLIGREAAEILRQELKQTVIVDNRPGGNGVLGLQLLAKAAPDGYTIGLLAITAAIAPHLGSTGFDPFKDFAPIANMVSTTPVFVANKESPFNNLSELAAYAKANPGKVAYGTPGVGTIPHLAAELFQAQAGVKLNHIPYKGAAQQIQDLIGGSTQLDSQSSLVVALPQLKADRIKPIAVLSENRSPLVPGVPTARESGFPGMVVAPWFGLGAPGGTSPEIVQRLHAALVKGLAGKEAQEKFASTGMVVHPSRSPAEFSQYIRTEHARWGKIIKDGNIKAE